MSNSSQITAEWVVRAELTIHRPKVDNLIESSENQCLNSQHTERTAHECFNAKNPINVVYEWCSSTKNSTDSSSVVGTILDVPKSSHFASKDSCSFRSTGVTSNDSGFDTTKVHAHDHQINNTKHLTTCNIILSASMHENPEAANITTNHSAEFSNKEGNSGQSLVPKKNASSMRDAYSQTSDTNIENIKDYGKVSNESISNRIRKERTNKGHSLESNLSSLNAPLSASNMPTKPGKKPRTVHIDVYCTGSDSEDQSSEGIEQMNNNCIHDLESNSTQQTVFNSNRMKLNHTRIKDAETLPRRLADSNKCHSMDSNRYAALREYLLAQSDPLDDAIYDSTHEISFNNPEMFVQSTHSLNEMKKYSNLQNETSDNCISSNYPNSSRSTIRDLTCSSISSALANSSSANIFDDESSWKETEIGETSHGPSDYCGDDIFNDQSRLQNAEQIWNESNVKSNIYQPLERFQLKSGPMKSNLAVKIEHLDVRMNAIRPEFSHSKSVDSSLSSGPIKTDRNLYAHSKSEHLCRLIPGYTREYLLKAQIFGTVVRGMKKPGHHVGPAKNPDCQCEYCRRWFSQRSYSRDRASSLDVTFIDYSNAVNSYDRQNI